MEASKTNSGERKSSVEQHPLSNKDVGHWEIGTTFIILHDFFLKSFIDLNPRQHTEI